VYNVRQLTDTTAHLDLYCFNFTRFSYQEDRRGKPGNLPKSNAVWEIGDLWIRKDFHISFVMPKSVPWLTRLVDSLSPRRPGFHHRPVPVRFVVDKVDMGRGVIRRLWFSPTKCPFSSELLLSVTTYGGNLVCRFTALYLVSAVPLPEQAGSAWKHSHLPI